MKHFLQTTSNPPLVPITRKKRRVIPDCVITYPGATTVHCTVSGWRETIRNPPRKLTGKFHGVTQHNPDALIVEDTDGQIHVVSDQIVRFI